MIGGYTGDGFKTVIPSKASAKISFRLVVDQDPEKIAASFQAFVRERLPADCKVDFIAHGGSPAIRCRSPASTWPRARRALADEWASEPAADRRRRLDPGRRRLPAHPRPRLRC